MKNSLKGSLALFVSRTTAGLNVNCNKYLLPLWIAPMQLVTLRLVFGALFFWIIAIFDKPDTSSKGDKCKLFILGAFAVFGYMSLYAVGIIYTTPMNFALFNATQAIWVFVFSIFLRLEKMSAGKFWGVMLAFGGVVATVFSQPASETASNPLLGNGIALASAMVYAVYLLSSSALLRRVTNLTMLRYTFSGAACSSMVYTFFTGFEMPRLVIDFTLTPALVVLFILLFPTALSYLLVPIGMKYLKTTLVAVYGYLTLIVATIVSLLLGQDKFDFMLFISFIFICLGVFMVNRAEKK